MKIVYCYPGMHYCGGIERVIVNKANYLVQHNYEVSIVTTDQQGRPSAFPLDKRVKCCDLGINYSLNWNRSFVKKVYHYFYDYVKHKRSLTAFLEKEKPDIVVSLFREEETILPRIKDGSKKIVEFHFSRAFFNYSYRSGWRGYLDRYRYAKMLSAIREYDKFIILTQEDKPNWKNFKNIEVIPNASTFKCKDLALLESKKVIAVGRYVFQKGFNRLIQAWSLVDKEEKGWTLHIIGEGDLKNDLQRQINDLGLSHSVFLEGNSTNIQSEYLNASILVMSSVYEGLPMIMLEAMSCGLPVVSFTFPCGPRDLIVDGENGFLVPDGDIEGLANKLLYLIKHANERKEMGRKAYLNTENFSEEKIMNRWITLFNELKE